MAHSAGLVLLRLIVERWNGRGGGINREGVTFQTQKVDIAPFQQSRVVGAMGSVTGNTTFGLDRGMLESEWSGFVSMAVETDDVLCSSGAQLRGQESTVLIVAVGTVDQPFIHPMVGGLGKIRFDFKMAAIAQVRLGCFQQEAVDLG